MFVAHPVQNSPLMLFSKLDTQLVHPGVSWWQSIQRVLLKFFENPGWHRTHFQGSVAEGV